MDQIKNLKDDPEKLEAVLKEYWKNLIPQEKDLLLLKNSQKLV